MLTLKRFVVASVLLALIATSAFAVVAQRARAQEGGTSVACDSTLMILLYIAQRDYDFTSSNIDLVMLDRGQFTPLFDNLSMAQAEQEMADTAGQEGDTDTGDQGATGDTGADDQGAVDDTGADDTGATGQIEPPGPDAGFTMLVPGNVEGEDPVCAQLRQDLTDFFFQELYTDTAGMQDEIDQQDQTGAGDQGQEGMTGDTGTDTQDATGDTGTDDQDATGDAGTGDTGAGDQGAVGDTGTDTQGATGQEGTTGDTGATDQAQQGDTGQTGQEGVAGQTGTMMACDSTLTILLYLAHRDYGFESTSVDVAQVDYGQFTPLFDHLVMITDQTGQAGETGVGDQDQADQDEPGETGAAISPDPSFTMLSPGNVAGENASCMQLRQELVDFFFQSLFSEDETQDQIGQQDQGDQQGATGDAGVGTDTGTGEQDVTGDTGDTSAGDQGQQGTTGDTGTDDEAQQGDTGTDDQGEQGDTGTGDQGATGQIGTDQQGQQTTAGVVGTGLTINGIQPGVVGQQMSLEGSCLVSPGGNFRVNLRTGPGLNFSVFRQLNPGEQMNAVAAIQDQSGFAWLLTEDGYWARQDALSSQNVCQVSQSAQAPQDEQGQQVQQDTADQAGQVGQGQQTAQTQQAQIQGQQRPISTGAWVELRITHLAPLVYIPASCVQGLPSLSSIAWQGSRAGSVDFARQTVTAAQQQHIQEQITQIGGQIGQDQFGIGQDFLVTVVCTTPVYEAPGGTPIETEQILAGQTWFASPYLWLASFNAGQQAGQQRQIEAQKTDQAGQFDSGTGIQYDDNDGGP